MKRVLATLAIIGVLCGNAMAQEKTPPKSVLERVSYAIGLSMGRNMAADDVKLDLNWMIKGVQDGMAKDSKPLLTDEELQQSIASFQEQMQKQQEEKLKAQVEKNKAEGAAFLADNAKKAGIVTTKSGLQYQVLKKGTGASPKATDTVKVHYHGTLIDGTVFDSSVDRGEPAQFPVNRVIQGWTEALQLMKVGDKFKLFIPSELAYGERGAGSDIGPNSVLIFDVELLDIPK